VNSEYSDRYLQLSGQLKKSCRKIVKKQTVKVNRVLTLLIGISLASHAFKMNCDTASYTGWERGGRLTMQTEQRDDKKSWQQ